MKSFVTKCVNKHHQKDFDFECLWSSAMAEVVGNSSDFHDSPTNWPGAESSSGVGGRGCRNVA
jgi:hypothetical protein